MNKDIHSYYLQQLNIPQWQVRAPAALASVLDSQIPDGTKLIFIYQGPNLLWDDFKLFLSEIGSVLHFSNTEIGHIFFSNSLAEKINYDELIMPNQAVKIIFSEQDLPQDVTKTQSKIYPIRIDENFNWQSIQSKKYLMQQLIHHGLLS